MSGPGGVGVSFALRPVFAFVDWDTARRCLWLPPVERARIHNAGARAQLDAVCEAIANRVAANRLGERCRLEIRVYHGWHRGNEPTDDYRSLTGASLTRSIFADSRVVVAPPVISDSLACGGRYRLLRDTVRRRQANDGLEQKMVDTAIAADLLYLARSSTGGSGADFLVVSEDDDMIPPVVVAREWGVPCRILRTRDANRCLPLSQELLYPFTT